MDPRSLRPLAALFVLCAAPALASPRQGERAGLGGGAGPLDLEIREELRRALELRSPERAALVRAVAERGSRATAPLLAIALAGTEEAAFQAGGSPPAPGTAPLRTVAVEALAQRPEREVLEALERASSSERDPERLVQVAEVVGEIGTAQAVSGLLDLSVRAAEGGALQEGHAARIARALARVLRRDEAAFEAIEGRTYALAPPARAVLARALEHAGGPRSLALLASMLGDGADSGGRLLEAILRGAREGPAWLDEPGLEAVRARLASSEPREQRLAALIAAELGDALAFPALCELLDQGDERVRWTAHESLQALSGLRMPPSRGRWLAWYERERGWLASEARRLAQALASRDPAEAVQAIAALGEHPLFRHDLAAEIAPLLASERPQVAAAACAGLARLGSARAIQPLLQAREQESEALRQAASRALAELARRRR